MSMDMRKSAGKAFAIFIAVMLVSALFASCGGKPSAGPGQTTPAGSINQLPAVEIQEYNGHKLSPISDVKDVSIAGPQKIDIAKYRLKIDGLVETPGDFTYDEVLKYPAYTKEVVLNCVEGWSADILWQGILLQDLFDTVKVRPEANTVIFYAADGYTTSLPLKEIQDKKMIIAYKMNGVVLPEEDGYPFILVAENKLGYKWVKWLTHMELSSDENYKGYWESRGYSNDADVSN
jgi:DMSO/TMAO reductase YedYZ molybdopterin-dependent catalytic subunit